MPQLESTTPAFNALFFLKVMATIAAIAVAAALLYALLSPTVITATVGAGLVATGAAALWFLPLILIPIVAIVLAATLLNRVFYTPQRNLLNASTYQPDPVYSPWYSRFFNRRFDRPTVHHHAQQPTVHGHNQGLFPAHQPKSTHGHGLVAPTTRHSASGPHYTPTASGATHHFHGH
jgi:hypothetical protein